MSRKENIDWSLVLSHHIKPPSPNARYRVVPPFATIANSVQYQIKSSLLIASSWNAIQKIIGETATKLTVFCDGPRKTSGKKKPFIPDLQDRQLQRRKAKTKIRVNPLFVKLGIER